MPLVRVEIIKGKTAEYKKALLEGIYLAMKEVLHIPESERKQRLYELDKDNFEISQLLTDKYTLY